jgi:hypothetical protein
MEFTAYDIALIPLIIALVEIIKQVTNIPGRWVPLLNLALGQIAAFVYVSPDDPKYAVLSGLVMAFSAMGMWSGTKNIIGK